MMGYASLHPSYEVNRMQYTESATTEERFRLALEASPSGILMIDSAGIIVLVNEAIERLFDYGRAELIGQSIDLLVPERYRENHGSFRNNFVAHPQTRAMGVGRELYGRRRDGSEFALEIGLTPLTTPEGKFVISSIIDISERKKLEDLLKEKNELLESNISHLKQIEIQLLKRNKELDDFSYIVSHDLKAPLRGIYTLADWIYKDNVAILSADAKDNLDALQNRTKRMGMLIEGVLKYSRVGRGSEEHIAVDMHKLVQDVIEMLQPPAGIEISIRTQLPIIYCERIQIEQVFQNLLGNAIKHMGKPQGKVEVNCVAVGHQWHFSVKDTGPGIAQRYYNKIFEMFSTLVPRDVIENTGVGLCIAKKIIEHFGGQIWVESVVGEGSTFHFTLTRSRLDRLF